MARGQKQCQSLAGCVDVRVNANEDVENHTRVTSYLAVVKVTPEKICVTHKVSPGAKANGTARRAADSSQTAACLKEVAP